MENTYIITKQGSSDIILSVGGSSVGPRGVKGDPGANGASAGFGTPSASVTTLNPGSSASVSISASGPDTEKVFNFEFGIPKGADGERGADGAPGRDGIDGKDGEDGAPGPKGDSGVYIGTTAPTDGSTVWLNPNGTVNAGLVPDGGTSGQVLGKLSNSDLDYGWISGGGGGEMNVIEVVQKNGVALPVSNKTVNVTVPVNTSDLNNDSGFTAHGVPSGGVSGQVLAKSSATDYDLTWVNQSGGGSGHDVPSGGSQGQILGKNSATDYDYGWVNAPSGTIPAGGNTGDYLTRGWNSSQGEISEWTAPPVKQSFQWIYCDGASYSRGCKWDGTESTSAFDPWDLYEIRHYKMDGRGSSDFWAGTLGSSGQYFQIMPGDSALTVTYNGTTYTAKQLAESFLNGGGSVRISCQKDTWSFDIRRNG